MPGTYPMTPRPSMVSVPEVIGKTIMFQTDQGYELRRAQWSRPKRRWVMEYLGMSAANVRTIRHFLYQQRLGALDFAWFHPTAVEVGTVQNTTPVTVLLTHGLFTGQWVGMSNTPNASLNGGVFPITVLTESSFTLNGTTGAGAQGFGTVVLYVPHAKAVMQEDTLPSPATLIGPDQIGLRPDGSRYDRTGFFNFNVTIEELF